MITKKQKRLIITLLPLSVITTAIATTISSTSNGAVQTNKNNKKILQGYPKEKISNPNLLIGKKVIASSIGDVFFLGEQLKAEHAIDNNETSEWRTKNVHTNNNVISNNTITSDLVDNITLEVDLEKEEKIESFKVHFTSSNVKNFEFQYQENNSTEWKTAGSISNAKGTQFYYNLQNPINALKVRLKINDWDVLLNNQFAVGVYNFGAFKNSLQAPKIDPNPNLSIGRPIFSSHPPTFNANPLYAIDDFYINPNSFIEMTKESYETSLVVNLSDTGVDINAFRLRFVDSSIKRFQIETSTDGTNYLPSPIQYESKIQVKTHTINLSKKISNVRKIKITFQEWDGKKIQLLDLGVYGNKLNDTSENIASSITKDYARIDQKTNKLIFQNIPEGYKFNFIGADLEQIIDKNLNIIKPLTDKEVVFDFEIVKNDNPSDKFLVEKQKITIPGLHTQQANKNQKPKIIPEIAEWFSDTDANTENSFLTLNDSLEVYVINEPLGKTSDVSLFLNLFKDQYKFFTKREKININRVQSLPQTISAGSIVFDFLQSDTLGYDDETYTMKIDDNNVNIKTRGINGARYATQSLLQILKINGSNLNKIQKGSIRDYPKFKIRGLSLDVAKKPISLEMLHNIVLELSWFKLNQLQLNLSDNSYFIEDHVGVSRGEEGINNGYKTYSAFRLESDIKNNGVKLTSSDFSYTKKQFKDFINFAKSLGVSIVPNINIPGHALSITKVFKELANTMFPQNTENPNRPLISNLDLSNQNVINIIRNILGEYVNGQNSIFSFGTGITVNIGGEEFDGNASQYYNFLKQVFDFLKSRGIPIRINGSLTKIGDIENNPITRQIAKEVELVIWNLKSQNPSEAYNQGFKLINALDTELFIVPKIHNFYPPNLSGIVADSNTKDRNLLDTENIYDNWNPESIGKHYIPVGSEQLLGAMFTFKSDFITDTRHIGLSEYDIFKRLVNSMPSFSAKTWGKGSDTFQSFENQKNSIGASPFVNVEKNNILLPNRKDFFFFDFDGYNDDERLFDKRGDKKYINNLVNANLGEENQTTNTGLTEKIKYIQLSGKNSSAKLPIGVLGLNNSLRFRVKRGKIEQEQAEEILFSAAAEYGDFSIKSKQKGTGKFGFSREGIDYSFEYELPIDKWVDIELRNIYTDTTGRVELTADGKKYSSPTGRININNAPLKKHDGTTLEINYKNFGSSETFMYPLEFIGSTINSFNGKITNIRSEPIVITKSDSMPNSYNLFERSAELQRLEKIILSITNDSIEDLTKLTTSNLTISGATNTTEKIETEIIPIQNNTKHVIIRVTLTSISNPDIKFTRDYHLTVITNLTKFLDELNASIKSDASLSTFTLLSVTEYKTKIEELRKKINDTKTANSEKINEFRTELNSINNSILKGFNDDINQTISTFKTLNEAYYEVESFDAAKIEFKKVEEEYSKLTGITQEIHKTYADRLAAVNNALKLHKDVVLISINESLAKANSNLNTPESVKTHNENINAIKNEVNKDTNVTLEKRTAYIQKINEINVLITYKSVLEEKIKNFENTINPLEFQEPGRNAYNAVLADIKNNLSQAQTINRSQYMSLDRKLDLAKLGLVAIQSSTENNSKKSQQTVRVGLSVGEIVGIVFGIIFGILTISITSYKVLFRKKRKK